MTNPQTEALHAFYNFKSHLLPAFLERNKRSLGSIEAELLRQRFTPEDKQCNHACATMKENLMICDRCGTIIN